MTTNEDGNTGYASGWYADQMNPGTERFYDGTAWTAQTRVIPSGSEHVPGWYADESAPGTERYFDGAAWTAQSRAVGSEPAPVAKAKGKKKGWIIGGSIAAGILLIGGIGAAVGGGNDRKETIAAIEPSASPVAEAEPVVDEEPEVAEPVLVTVPPNLVGMTAVDASAELAKLGLLATYDGEPDAKVTTMMPAGGAQLEVGGAVVLTVEQKPTATVGQQNAISKAQSYLDLMGFSRAGLIEQLAFEGFSAEDSTFAVDTIAPDWNQEAAEKAQSYLDMTSFSRQSLIDQLLFEEFTPAEAEFGVAAVGY